MKKTVKRVFWVWQQDKEKIFLQDMALEGYQLVKVGLFKYTFEKNPPQKLIYQMDFRVLGGNIKKEEYIQIFEDAGWHFVTSANGWYYFFQEWQEDVDLSIFSDNESKSKVLLRLIGFLLLTGFPLYYQAIFILPQLKYSGVFILIKIIMGTITLVHFLAMLKILSMYKKIQKEIKE